MEYSLMKHVEDEIMFSPQEDSDGDIPDELFETNDEPEMSTDHDSKKRKMLKLEIFLGNPCKLKRINTTRSDCDSSKNKAKEAKVGESKPPKKMSETSEANNLPNDHTPG